MKTKRIINTVLAIALIGVFALFALASSDSTNTTTDQGNGSADTTTTSETNLGDYQVEIKSCRLAKDFENKDVVIVMYGFTNNGKNAISFTGAFDEEVYQNGVGLNRSWVVDDSANYDEGNQTKEIKTGASLDVEIAYELNDTATDIEVEVKQFLSFDNSVVKKTFSITQ